LSFNHLRSGSHPHKGLKFGYSFNTHYCYIARCTLVVQMEVPMLSRVT